MCVIAESDPQDFFVALDFHMPHILLLFKARRVVGQTMTEVNSLDIWRRTPLLLEL